MKTGVVDGEDPELLKSGGSVEALASRCGVSMGIISPMEIFVSTPMEIIFIEVTKKPALGGLGWKGGLLQSAHSATGVGYE
jgi:hypothetical protein